MTATKTTTRVRSESGERSARRALAAATAAHTGRIATLAMALLGPSSPPSGLDRRPDGEPAVPRYEWRTSVFGRRAYLGLVGPYPSILDDARQRLAELERKWAP